MQERACSGPQKNGNTGPHANESWMSFGQFTLEGCNDGIETQFPKNKANKDECHLTHLA